MKLLPDLPTHDLRASLPFPLRLVLRTFYPPHVLESLDERGKQHDLELSTEPWNWDVANRRFIGRLRNDGLPRHVIFLVDLGITLYFNSPRTVKKLIWITIPKA